MSEERWHIDRNDINTYIERFYNARFIPIYYYESGICVAQAHPLMTSPFVPAQIERELLKAAGTMKVVETPLFSYYGSLPIEATGGILIIGPVKPGGYSEQDLASFMGLYRIPGESRPDFLRSFNATPSIPLLQFHNILLELGFQFCPSIDRIDTYHDLRIDTIELETYSEEKQVDYDSSKTITLRETIETTFPLIRDGNLETLMEISKNGFRGNFGEYTDDLRQNQLIVMAMSIGIDLHAVFQGGMPDAEAYAIARYYLSRALKARTAAEVDELSMSASLHFIKSMKKFREERYSQSPLYPSIQYIRSRVFSPLKVSEVAAFSGYSEEHFSRLFKKETGVNPTEYILGCKLDEAKTLLELTDYSIGEIAERLCFSNQSHFQRRFKERNGMTPRQYRISTRRD